MGFLCLEDREEWFPNAMNAKIKGDISKQKKKEEKDDAWRKDQRSNEGDEVTLYLADLVYQSFHKFGFGKGSKHKVNPSKRAAFYSGK